MVGATRYIMVQWCFRMCYTIGLLGDQQVRNVGSQWCVVGSGGSGEPAIATLFIVILTSVIVITSVILTITLITITLNRSAASLKMSWYVHSFALPCIDQVLETLRFSSSVNHVGIVRRHIDKQDTSSTTIGPWPLSGTQPEKISY